MYHAQGRLPHLLRPEAYVSAAFAVGEAQALFRGAWHMVGTLDDLPRHGDFLTRVVMGHALLVRNIEGEIRTFSNVCAHRHCLLKTEARGRSSKLVCPYHGWRFDSKGRVFKSGGQEYFNSPDGERPALIRYRTQLCGRLIFVAVDEDAMSLKAFLGEFYSLVAERFGEAWRQDLAMDPDYPCNWKVQVENTLEGYHAASVHPDTFRSYPDENTLEHRLLPRGSQFRNVIIFGRDHWLGLVLQQIETAILRRVRCQRSNVYRHIHVFPNLTFSFSDSMSNVQCIQPTSATRAYGILRQFGPRGLGARWWDRALLLFWRRTVLASVSRRITREDFSVYARTQQGLNHSRQEGMLGRLEERIHHFHKWIVERMQSVEGSPQSAGGEPLVKAPVGSDSLAAHPGLQLR